MESNLNWQESLPFGATLVPILLASNKTTLTSHVGDKEAWPLYLSIGNISMNDRQSAWNDSWIPITYLPVVKFSDGDDSEVTTAVIARLFHSAIRIVLESLLEAKKNWISDARPIRC